MRILVIFMCLILNISVGHAQVLTAQNDPDAIVGAVSVQGQKDIAAAWFILPVSHYPHHVRGQPFDPSGIRVRLGNGQYATYILDGSHVFEDRTPRLADLDGDGKDEIILVLSSTEKGSALAAYSVENGEIVLKARTGFIGRAFRWLNPAGIADYNGDGALDVALVQKPHLSKRLEFWTLRGDTFFRLASVENISNHQNGSEATHLSASTDFDGDGIVDLAILSGDYRTLRLIKFVGDQAREFAKFPLPSLGVGNFILHQNQLLVPMANGENFELNF